MIRPDRSERRSIGAVISDAVRRAVGPADVAKASSPSTKMAVALNHKRGVTYVRPDKATIQRRRAANKRARAARQVHRRAAR